MPVEPITNMNDMNGSPVDRKMASALRARGFIVRLQAGGIDLHPGNPDIDLRQLSDMLLSLGIGHTIRNRLLTVEVSDVSDETLHKLVWFAGYNSESRTYEAASRWKYFAQRTHAVKIPTLNLDPGVAALCKSLSAAGISTFMSCDGHGRRAPYLLFSSVYHAFWFKLIQSHRLAALPLRYEWTVRRHRQGDTYEWTALPRRGCGWDLEWILADTLLMADAVYRQADELSRLRRQLFGRSIKTTRRWVKSLDNERLYDWMAGRWP